MITLEQQAKQLSTKLAGFDHQMETLRRERLATYFEWQQVVRDIGEQRNLEEQARQPHYQPAEGAQHHGFVQNPLEEWDKAHAH